MSYLFDGIDDKITYTHQTGLDSATAFTLSFWAKFASPASGWGRIVSQESGGANGVALFYPQNTDATKLNLVLYGSGTHSAEKTSVFSTGSWTHVFLAWSTANASVDIYVNGTQVTGLTTSGSFTSALNIATGQSFTLGAQSDGGTFWTGRIAEVAAWWGEDLRANSTLIANLAAGWKADDATNGRPSGLDFYTPLKDDANDDSANAYTGTVTGAALDGDHPTMQSGGGTTPRNRVYFVL